MGWDEIGLSINIGGRLGELSFRSDRQHNGLDMEARRVAYMLNTGDPYAEHEGAMQLSQDLYGMPTWAQTQLIQRTQMYENPEMGARLVVDPVLQEVNGYAYDTGNRTVRVVDEQFGLNDEVTYLQSSMRGYYRPGADLFLGVNNCYFRNDMPWMNEEWREHSREERNYWRDRDEWREYDGRRRDFPEFVRPNVGRDFDVRINDFHQNSRIASNNFVNNFHNSTTVQNYFSSRVQNNTTIINQQFNGRQMGRIGDDDRREHQPALNFPRNTQMPQRNFEPATSGMRATPGGIEHGPNIIRTLPQNNGSWEHSNLGSRLGIQPESNQLGGGQFGNRELGHNRFENGRPEQVAPREQIAAPRPEAHSFFAPPGNQFRPQNEQLQHLQQHEQVAPREQIVAPRPEAHSFFAPPGNQFRPQNEQLHNLQQYNMHAPQETRMPPAQQTEQPRPDLHRFEPKPQERDHHEQQRK